MQFIGMIGMGHPDRLHTFPALEDMWGSVNKMETKDNNRILIVTLLDTLFVIVMTLTGFWLVKNSYDTDNFSLMANVMAFSFFLSAIGIFLLGLIEAIRIITLGKSNMSYSSLIPIVLSIFLICSIIWGITNTRCR